MNAFKQESWAPAHRWNDRTGASVKMLQHVCILQSMVGLEPKIVKPLMSFAHKVYFSLKPLFEVCVKTHHGTL